MNLSEYQDYCKTNWGPGVEDNPLYFVVGLAGETGEVCEEFKKAIRDRRTLNKDNVKKELGDVLWYIANICSTTGISLQEVINANVCKLNERHGGTYKSSEDRISRGGKTK